MIAASWFSTSVSSVGAYHSEFIAPRAAGKSSAQKCDSRLSKLTHNYVKILAHGVQKGLARARAGNVLYIPGCGAWRSGRRHMRKEGGLRVSIAGDDLLWKCSGARARTAGGVCRLFWVIVRDEGLAGANERSLMSTRRSRREICHRN